MKIPEINQLQMNRTDTSHYGTKRIEPLTAETGLKSAIFIVTGLIFDVP